MYLIILSIKVSIKITLNHVNNIKSVGDTEHVKGLHVLKGHLSVIKSSVGTFGQKCWEVSQLDSIWSRWHRGFWTLRATAY